METFTNSFGEGCVGVGGRVKEVGGGEEWVGNGEDFVFVVCPKKGFFGFSFAFVRHIGKEGNFAAHTGKEGASLGERMVFGVGIFTIPGELGVGDWIPGSGFGLVKGREPVFGTSHEVFLFVVKVGGHAVMEDTTAEGGGMFG